MTKAIRRSYMIIFWLELALVLVIPFIICWSTTPINVLNSHLLFKLLETIGLSGSGLIFLAGIPVGIIGIINAKRIGKLRIATIVLSIINLSAGTIENVMLICMFFAVVFGRVSV